MPLGWGSKRVESRTEGAAEPLTGKCLVRGALLHPRQLSCWWGSGYIAGVPLGPSPLLGDPAPGLNRIWLPQSSISCPCGQGPLSPELGRVQVRTQSSVAIPALMSPSLSALGVTQSPRAGAQVRHAMPGHASPLPILCHPAVWCNHRIALLCCEATVLVPAAHGAPAEAAAPLARAGLGRGAEVLWLQLQGGTSSARASLQLAFSRLRGGRSRLYSPGHCTARCISLGTGTERWGRKDSDFLLLRVLKVWCPLAAHLRWFVPCLQLCWEQRCPAGLSSPRGLGSALAPVPCQFIPAWEKCEPDGGSRVSKGIQEVQQHRLIFAKNSGQVIAKISQAQVALSTGENQSLSVLWVPMGRQGWAGGSRASPFLAEHLPAALRCLEAPAMGDPGSTCRHVVFPGSSPLPPTALPWLLICLNSLPRSRWPWQPRGAGLSPSRRLCSPSGCLNRRPLKPNQRCGRKRAARSTGTQPAVEEPEGSLHPRGEGNAACLLASPESLCPHLGTLQPLPGSPCAAHLGAMPMQQQRLGGSL